MADVADCARESSDLALNKLKCPHCNYIAKHRRTLKRHLIIHSGVRSFSCDICGKLFTRREHVKRHSLVGEVLPGVGGRGGRLDEHALVEAVLGVGLDVVDEPPGGRLLLPPPAARRRVRRLTLYRSGGRRSHRTAGGRLVPDEHLPRPVVLPRLAGLRRVGGVVVVVVVVVAVAVVVVMVVSTTTASGASCLMLMFSASLMNARHVAGHRHHLDGVLAGQQQVARVKEVQDDREALDGGQLQVRRLVVVVVLVLALGQAVEGLEEAAAGHQDVLVRAEHLAAHHDVDVAEDPAAPLLVELLQQLHQSSSRCATCKRMER
ncbi:hypothetical protein CRUP_037897 [Coryphaenoides rupestris]|nr:hypothetical protein CRUP_037897 [Coryphaenoides rupestris]